MALKALNLAYYKVLTPGHKVFSAKTQIMIRDVNDKNQG